MDDMITVRKGEAQGASSPEDSLSVLEPSLCLTRYFNHAMLRIATSFTVLEFFFPLFSP